MGGQERDFQAQGRDRIVEFGAGFLGGVHGDHGCGGEPVGIFAEDVGVVGVERPAGDLAQFVIAGVQGGHADAGINHAEVQAGFVQATVEQLGQGAGRPVKGVFGRVDPPVRPRGAQRAALLAGQLIPAKPKRHIRRLLKALDRPAAANVTHIVKDRRLKLGRMAVRVDNRVVQPGPDGG